MQTVIGLFDNRANAQAAATAAAGAGIPPERIKLLDQASPEADLIEPTPRPITMKIIRSFTLLGVVVFAIFGLASAYFSIYVTNAQMPIAIAIFVVFVLIGLFCGLFMGWVKGRSDADQALQAYREAFEAGDVIVAVQTDQRAKQLVALMGSHQAHATYLCQRPNRMQRTPSPHELAAVPAH